MTAQTRAYARLPRDEPAPLARSQATSSQHARAHTHARPRRRARPLECQSSARAPTGPESSFHLGTGALRSLPPTFRPPSAPCTLTSPGAQLRAVHRSGQCTAPGSAPLRAVPGGVPAALPHAAAAPLFSRRPVAAAPPPLPSLTVWSAAPPPLPQPVAGGCPRRPALRPPVPAPGPGSGARARAPCRDAEMRLLREGGGRVEGYELEKLSCQTSSSPLSADAERFGDTLGRDACGGILL